MSEATIEPARIPATASQSRFGEAAGHANPKIGHPTVPPGGLFRV